MGIAAGGVVIESGDNVAVLGIEPSGIAAKGLIVYERRVEEKKAWWNPDDKATEITLSSDTRMATIPANGPSPSANVRSEKSIHPGDKTYFEVQLTRYAQGSTTRYHIGLAPADTGLYAQISSDVRAIILRVTGPDMGAADPTAALNGIAQGSTVGFAVDFASPSQITVWVTINGVTWNNGGSSNPATGTGGLSWSTGVSEYFIIAGGHTLAGLDVTLLEEPVLTVPSGFSFLFEEPVEPPVEPEPEPIPFLTITQRGTSRSDATPWVGFRFQVGPDPIVVVKLGRWIEASNYSNHTINLLNSAGNLVTSAVVPQYQTALDFAFVTLESPVTLAAGQVFYLISREALGDPWLDSNTTFTTTADATVTGGSYMSGAGTGVPTTATGKFAYVPPNFQYYVQT